MTYVYYTHTIYYIDILNIKYNALNKALKIRARISHFILFPGLVSQVQYKILTSTNSNIQILFLFLGIFLFLDYFLVSLILINLFSFTHVYKYIKKHIF